jgi:hypothetical protein
MIRPVHVLGSRFFRLFYRPQRFYPIRSGPLQGLKIRFGPHLNVQEMLGFWERNNFEAIIRLQDAGLLASSRPVMYDIGANFGLYSLFFSRLLGRVGRVFAFEPAEFPRTLMIDNLRRNNIGDVLVENLACLIRLAPPSSISRKIIIIRHRSDSSLQSIPTRNCKRSGSTRQRSMIIGRKWLFRASALCLLRLT